MSTSSMKRPAGEAPAERASKRHMSSSPEEGELDDPSPPPLPPERRDTPNPHSTTKTSNKVPFPFKKKAAPSNGHSEGPPPRRDTYGRPNEYDRRYRDEDSWRNSHAHGSRDEACPPWTGDYWATEHDSRGAPQAPRRDSYGDRFTGDRSYRSRDNAVNNWDSRPTRTLVSPQTASRRTRSPSSPRSRSPSTNGSPDRGKHRLPRPSAVDLNSRVEYETDKGRGYRGNRWRGTSPVSSNAPQDMHYRLYDSSTQDMNSPDFLRREEIWDASRLDGGQHYPASPQLSPRPSPPRSSHIGAGTSPPPSEGLSYGTNGNKRSRFLPNSHTAVKISLPKRIVSPRERSPPVSLLAGKDGRTLGTDTTQHHAEILQPAKVSSKLKRKPLQRSREEETAAYGRVFQGCGQQSDYEVINKLGEGTFGYVNTYLSAIVV
jgi:serine/threonine-protein kinase BUR1